MPRASEGSAMTWIIIAIVIGAIIIFFVTRELWCWYLKINRRCMLLEQQNGLMRQLINEQVQSNIMMSQLLAAQTGKNPAYNGPAPDFQGMNGQPNMGQPNMGQPNMGQPNMNQPNMGQPNMGQPYRNTPNAGQPGAQRFNAQDIDQ